MNATPERARRRRHESKAIAHWPRMIDRVTDSSAEVAASLKYAIYKARVFVWVCGRVNTHRKVSFNRAGFIWDTVGVAVVRIPGAQ